MSPQSSAGVDAAKLSSCAAARATVNTPPFEMSIAPAAKSFGGQATSAPLQSSSTPLPHSSALGAPAVASHCTPVCAPVQIRCPDRAHAPSPTEHACPIGNGSSTLLRQSSSRPLHSSTLSPVVSAHAAL